MFPPPSSIITHAELRRLDLLRDEQRERLAASACGDSPSLTPVSNMGRSVIQTALTLLATLRQRPQRLAETGGVPYHPTSVTCSEVAILTLVAAGLRNA